MNKEIMNKWKMIIQALETDDLVAIQKLVDKELSKK